MEINGNVLAVTVDSMPSRMTGGGILEILPTHSGPPRCFAQTLLPIRSLMFMGIAVTPPRWGSRLRLSHG